MNGRMKEISKHEVDTMFDIKNICMCNKIFGMYGMILSEGLHAFGNDVFETCITTVAFVIDVGNNDKPDKNDLDKLHHSICHLMKLWSERDIVQSIVRSGLTDGTKMVELKQCSNLIALIVAMKTTIGQELFTITYDDDDETILLLSDVILKWYDCK